MDKALASRKTLTNNINSNKPSWLLSTLSDLEERMRMLALVNPTIEEDNGDTFAERAESYYSKRPQLLTLLQDLYNAYVTLSDRYMQISSNYSHKRHQSQGSITANDNNDESDAGESDLESSLSYQQPPPHGKDYCSEYDAVVAELVAKSVEAEVLAEEARRCGEWRRKAELQGSLVEVLESERAVLLRENAMGERRMAALAEEAAGMAAEAAFMRRKAGELARCLLMRVQEEQRVCALTRKIEDLQGQIYGLEKRNNEYLQQSKIDSTEDSGTASFSSSTSGSVKRTKKKSKKRNEVVFEGCFRKLKLNYNNQKVIKKKRGDKPCAKNRDEKGISSWWEKVKSMDLFLCGVNSKSA